MKISRFMKNGQIQLKRVNQSDIAYSPIQKKEEILKV
jgi:hypothetical protein